MPALSGDETTVTASRIAEALAGSALQVVHVINSLTAAHGGPSYSVPGLAAALRKLGVHTKLRTLEGPGSARNPEHGVEYIEHALDKSLLGGFTRHSRHLHHALLRDAEAGAILHAHGLWLMPNVYPAQVKRRAGGAAKLVHSIRGMLSPDALRVSAWKKKPFWLLHQRSALQAADCLHATSEAEVEHIRTAGLRNPVAVIPNGVELPEIPSSKLTRDGDKTVLFLGRLHPIKGLDRLVRAWSVVEAEFQQWRLRIIGPSEDSYVTQLSGLAQSLGVRRLTIEPPSFGNEKFSAYWSAHLFVLPSLSENFGLSVAEALACEMPVICTRGAPWQDLETYGCGWWIPHGVDPLVETLRRAMSLSDEDRHVMGARGRALVQQSFSWEPVAERFHAVYRWLTSGEAAPSFVVKN